MAEQYKNEYVVDIDYTSGYYKELSPSFINFSLLANHIDPPSINEKFTYCELGCGKATSLLINAANYPNGTFYGIDFNPSHIKYGNYMAKKANLNNIFFYDMSFEQSVKKSKKFPNFDYIVFHGIYSWVNKKARKNLLDFCEQNLNSGGVIYNSYNALPGSTSQAQFQKLILETSYTNTSRSDIKMDYSLGIMEEFLNKDLTANNKQLKSMFDTVKKQNKSYLPHEYLNISWSACYFIDVEKVFSKKGFQYVNLCNPLEAFSSLVLPTSVNQFLNEHFTVGTPIFEHFKDYILNTSFRKDLYIKGIKKHNVLQVRDILSEYKFTFIGRKQDIPKEIQHALSNISIKEEIQKHFTKKIKENANFNDMIYNKDIPSTLFYISLFISAGIVGILHSNQGDNKSSQMLNTALCDEYSTTNDAEFISAFNTKHAIQVDIIDRLFYKFYNEKDLSSMPEKIEDYLSNKVNASIKNGAKENQTDYINKRFNIWEKDILPIWKKIGII